MRESFRESEVPMDNIIKKAGSPQLPSSTETAAVPAIPTDVASVNVSAYGEGIAVGALYGNINLNATPETLAVALRMLGSQQPSASHAAEWASLDTDRYNVFVIENEKYDCGAFCIGRRVALKNTKPEHKDYFRPLTDSLIQELLNMPCLFTVRNFNYKSIPNYYPAFLGKLNSIQCQGENIKFSFPPFAQLRQQFINDNIKAFGLLSRTVRNQLDEEHWSIRSGNLLQIAANLGIEIK